MKRCALLCRLASLCLAGLCLLGAGCTVTWRPPEEFSSQPEKTMSEIWEENDRMIEEMAPKKEELSAYYQEAVPQEYQDETWFTVEPTVVQRDLFSVTIQLDIKEHDTKLAREVARELYAAFSDPPYSVDSYRFTMIDGTDGQVVANVYRNTDEPHFNIEMKGVWEQYE